MDAMGMLGRFITASRRGDDSAGEAHETNG